jgi:ankyrin repeat protein
MFKKNIFALSFITIAHIHAMQLENQSLSKNDYQEFTKLKTCIKNLNFDRSNISSSFPLIKQLLENGITDKDCPALKNTFFDCCSVGYTEGVKTLLKAGISPNTQNDHGFTPIMCTIWNDNISAIKLLLEAHADLTVKTDCRCYLKNSFPSASQGTKYYDHSEKCTCNRRDALSIAQEKGNSEMMALLLEYSKRNK